MSTLVKVKNSSQVLASSPEESKVVLERHGEQQFYPSGKSASTLVLTLQVEAQGSNSNSAA